MVNESQIGFWGRFVCPDWERQYQREALTQDVAGARLVLWPMMVAFLLFLINDWRMFAGTSQFLPLLGLRLAVVVVSLAAIVRLRSAITPGAFELWMLAWSGLMIATSLYLLTMRPVASVNQGGTVLLIMIFSLLLPLRFALQFSTALAYTVGYALLYLSKNPAPLVLSGTMTILGLALILGLIAAQMLNRARRESFAAHDRERKVIESLEKALAEVKTLRGLLPICSSCKKIRQDDGLWKQVESYLQEHSQVEFTHGICPECFQRLYPDIAARKLAE